VRPRSTQMYKRVVGLRAWLRALGPSPNRVEFLCVIEAPIFEVVDTTSGCEGAVPGLGGAVPGLGDAVPASGGALRGGWGRVTRFPASGCGLCWSVFKVGQRHSDGPPVSSFRIFAPMLRHARARRRGIL